jgi:hypothetical protein
MLNSLLLLLRLFPCSDGIGVFRQPLNQPESDCFGLTFGFVIRSNMYVLTN